MGLAFVPAIGGYIGYWVGTQIDGRYGTGYAQLTGMIAGLALGIYEVYRQAIRIEGRGQG
jgi:hypothetical protein